ncbi:MAG: N-acetylglucosamine-6-phosphate deacetylase [Tepidiformaceae bacterium]
MSSLLVIIADQVVTTRGTIEHGAVVVESDRITAVDQANLIPVPSGAEVLSADVLMAGFIDLHVHGAAGRTFGEGTEASRTVARAEAAAGVTTCYAGLGAGANMEAIAQSVTRAAAAVGGSAGAARIAGIFMEGPFISPARKGAWNAAHLRPPSVTELYELMAAAQGQIRRVNVAPELPGALDFIREARAQGIIVSLGHSNATYEEALAGIEAGASIANHTYNAMSPLDHRNPGLVGAALSGDDLLAELILDRVHVHPAAAAALLRARGTSGVALITDASAMAGMGDGTYETPNRTVIVKDGSARLPDGTLAGSVGTFDQGVRNAASLLGSDLRALSAISSTNAAKAMGIASETGSVEVGLFADLVLLDINLQVQATISRGKALYRREKQE